MAFKPGGGGPPLIPALGGVSVSSRSAWSRRASSRTGFKATKKPCLEKPKKLKTKAFKMSPQGRTISQITKPGKEERQCHQRNGSKTWAKLAGSSQSNRNDHKILLSQFTVL